MSGQETVKLFKRSVIAWALRLDALLLIAAAIVGRREVILGLAFGICFGLINLDLMFRFNATLLRGSRAGKGHIAILGTFARLALLFAGAVAVHYKGWNLIAAAVGWFAVYPVLLLHGLRPGRGRAAASADAER